MKARITKRSVERVEPGDRDIYLWDTDLPMFGCKITPKGRRVYCLQYRINGRLRRYTIGRHGSLTAEQARHEAIRLLGQVAAGIDPAEIKQAGNNSPTVAELADRYMKEHAEVKKKPLSIKADERSLRLAILPQLGHLKISSVTASDLTRFHHAFKDEPVKANRALSLLSKMFNLAEKWGLRPSGSNPCRHVEKYKEKPKERFLSAEELARLGQALAKAEAVKSEMPGVLTAIRLLVLTGARLSEILNLRWEDVDLDLEIIQIQDSKTGYKILPLSSPAVEVLEKAPHLENNPWVCPGARIGRHLVNLQKPWRRLRADARLDDVRLHDLRHSFASMGAADGMGLPIIGALLGHKRASTTERYAHLANDPLRKATDRIGKKIAEAMNQRPKVIPIRK